MDTVLLLKFVSVFAFVMVLMMLFSRLLQRLGLSAAAGGVRKDAHRRLSVVEYLPLDQRRRLVLVRRDDREHLLVLGPEGECLVESGIPAKEKEEDNHVVAFARDPRNVKI